MNSEVRLKQGDRKKAMQNLEIALRDNDAPWQIYRSYAELQMLTGNTLGAASTVQRADARFGQPLGIAPFAIKVHRAAGDQASVEAYLNRCRVAGKRAHVKICEAAAGQQKPEANSGSATGGSGIVGSGFKLPGFGGGSGSPFSFGSKN